MDGMQASGGDREAENVRQGSSIAGNLAHMEGEGERTKISRMVCYGIGNFSVSASSLLQISLALLLKDFLHPPSSSLFDPVMTGAERQAAESLGFTIPQEDEVGLCTTDSDSLFFMPHCGRRLYSNVLRANWGPGNLSRLVVIGNSFGAYRMRNLSTDVRTSCCVEKLGEEMVVETLLPKHVEENSFIDTSVHSFPLKKLLLREQHDKEFWRELAADVGGDDHSWTRSMS
mmetsp:Transcript_412/g.913  ORF Transcript_412/g.913 Transcript_412/m.913 type:complete len:230 (-) Transcript_412:42-731(-)